MVGGLLAAPVPLVVHSDPWRFHKGTVAPQADWMTVAEAGLLASWGIGPGGFGYGDGDDATVLTDMRDQYSTLYLRAGFELPDDADLTEPVFLVVDYDDAFIAWINGVEIARRAITRPPPAEELLRPISTLAPHRTFLRRARASSR